MTNQELNTQNKLLKKGEYKGEKKTMNQDEPQETPDDTELLRLKAGYNQHTSLFY